MQRIRSSRGSDALAAALLVTSSWGCDVIQGLSDAGRAIFPDDRTHVDAPGSRIAAGNFSELDFAGVWLGKGVSGFKLLARTAVPGDDSLSVIGFTDGRVCRVEDVGKYVVSPNLVGSGQAMLSYLDGPGPRGTLRFADLHCELLPAVLPDATLSSATTADGRRIVITGSDLVLVDAATGVVEHLEADVAQVTMRAGGPHVVQADGHLSVYDGGWRLRSRHGEGVVRAAYVPPNGSTVVFEDSSGIWRLSPSTMDFLPVAADGCELAFPMRQAHFVTFRLPCNGGSVIAAGVESAATFTLGPDIDPEHVEFWKEDFPVGKLWVAHFRDFDAGAALGTLLLRSEDGRDLILGERAAPEWISPSSSGASGLALVNVDGEVGDLVHFDTSGTVRVVAERTLRIPENTGLLINFDGQAGDLAAVDSLGRVTLLIPKIPRSNALYLNQDLSVAAALNEFDGRVGTLSRLNRSSFELETVATGVLHPHHGFIEALLPGMAWIRAEGRGDTGTLEYQNTELLYTATVSEGVASFLSTTEGLIYSVPHGDGAGVWFAEAK
jgi:hypothetical protein